MEIDEQIAIMVAFRDGALIEFKNKWTDWVDLEDPVWNWDECDYRIYDVFGDLKTALAEGAVIEVKDTFTGEWFVPKKEVRFDADVKSYRIKDGFTFEQWEYNKDLISDYNELLKECNVKL